MGIVTERIRVRERNQVTIPKALADIGHITEGREVVAQIDADRPNEILLRIVPETYAGALTEVFAGVDTGKYVAEERDSWE